MSPHPVEVVPITLEPHPNADSLSLVRVGGYTVVVRTDDWKNVGQGAYIPPDSVCPDTPVFAWLGSHKRISAKRLRGVYSEGLLVPAPDGAKIGDDVSEVLGVTHYEPPVKVQQDGRQASFPQTCTTPYGHAAPLFEQVLAPVYSLDNWKKHSGELVEGEPVYVTEKIHGTNARYTWIDGRLWSGSHRTWRAPTEDDLYHRVGSTQTGMVAFLKEHPGTTVYGEIYGGGLTDLDYGTEPGKPQFAAFDIRKNGEWFHPGAFFLVCMAWGIPAVPLFFWPLGPDGALGDKSGALIAPMAYGPSVVARAEGASLLDASHVREGIVIKPEINREGRYGRVALKLVGNGYYERKAA